MIDHFCRWPTSSEARADAFALAQKFGITSSSGAFLWAQDHVLPDVKAWRPSQDVIVPSTIGSSILPTIVHNYQSGWFGIVSLNQSLGIILNSSRLAFALNRDGPPYIVRNNIGAIINDIAVSPVFAGSHYPIGGYN